MILRQSMIIIGIGLTIGLFGAFALTRWMGSLLYGVSAHDLSIHGLVLMVLAARGFDRELHSGAPRDAGRSDGGAALRVTQPSRLSRSAGVSPACLAAPAGQRPA